MISNLIDSPKSINNIDIISDQSDLVTKPDEQLNTSNDIQTLKSDKDHLLDIDDSYKEVYIPLLLYNTIVTTNKPLDTIDFDDSIS